MPENSIIPTERLALAESLELNRHDVVTEWTNAVRDDPLIPDADRLTLAALQDHLPELLVELIAVLRDPATLNDLETREAAQNHGKARWRNGYRLDEVLRELARVREMVLVRVRAFCDERNYPALRDDAEENVRRFFDTVVAESARQFMREQEAEVLLRTRQLHSAYEQVEAATDQLRAVAQSRLQLLRGVSHELRNAVQAVNFAATALLQEASRENRNSMSSQLSNSAAQLQRTLDRLQQFSHILTGEVRLHLAKLEPQDFLTSLEKPHRAAAQQKGLEWRCPAPANLPAIIIDHDKLRHIADVLLSNAVAHTAQGSVEVAVRGEGPDRWIFSVADTGVGIDGADAPHVFHEFHRRERTSRRGVGLGLVIARHLARLMEGEITFRSKLGEGTCFEVHLPIDLSSAAPPTEPTSNI